MEATTSIQKNSTENVTVQPNNSESNGNPTDSESINPTDIALIKKQMKLELDIKPTLLNFDQVDGGKTPPIPRRGISLSMANEIIFGSSMTELTDKHREILQSIEIPESPNNPFSTPTTCFAPTQNGASLPGSMINSNPQNHNPQQLTEMDYRYQLQVNRSASAVRMLTDGFDLLQRNIRDMLGVPDYPDPSTEDVNSKSNVDKPLQKVFSVSKGTDPVDDFDTEAEIQRLAAKLVSLEKVVGEKFKKLEMQRSEILKEIKISNEALLKLLEDKPPHNDSPTTGCKKIDVAPCGTKDRASNEILLPVNSLNLQRNWDECDEESGKEVEEDYEMMMAFESSLVTPSKENGNVLGENSLYFTPTGNRISGEEGQAGVTSSGTLSKIHKQDVTKPGYVCTCGTSYKMSHHLRSHTVYRNPPRFTCELCHKLFHFNKELNSHRAKEHNVPVQDTYTCYSCNKIFLTRSEVSKHRGVCHLASAYKSVQTPKKARTESSPAPK